MSASIDSERIERSESQYDAATQKSDDTETSSTTPSGASSYAASVKLFVGGISWDTTTNTLTEYFERFGSIEEASLMRDRKTGQPRGFAFISMSNLADAEEILAVKHQIDGRHVDVKPALPKGTAQTGVEGGYEHMVHQQKLFVAGLSQTTEASDLSSAFSSFGKVRDARIMLDRVSSTSRGFGFVEFEDSSVVLRLLKELPEVVCDGRLVEFKLALPKNSQSYSVQHARYPAPNTFRRIPGRFRGRHMNGYDTMGGGIVYTQYPFMGPVFRSPSESSSMLYGGIPMVTYDGHRSEPIP